MYFFSIVNSLSPCTVFPRSFLLPCYFLLQKANNVFTFVIFYFTMFFFFLFSVDTYFLHYFPLILLYYRCLFFSFRLIYPSYPRFSQFSFDIPFLSFVLCSAFLWSFLILRFLHRFLLIFLYHPLLNYFLWASFLILRILHPWSSSILRWSLLPGLECYRSEWGRGRWVREVTLCEGTEWVRHCMFGTRDGASRGEGGRVGRRRKRTTRPSTPTTRFYFTADTWNRSPS